MSGKRRNQKAIMFYAPDFVYEGVKEMSKKQGSTITSYILRALIAKLNLERPLDKHINY